MRLYSACEATLALLHVQSHQDELLETEDDVRCVPTPKDSSTAMSDILHVNIHGGPVLFLNVIVFLMVGVLHFTYIGVPNYPSR